MAKPLTAPQLRYLRFLLTITGDGACAVPIGPEMRTANALAKAGLADFTSVPGFRGVRITPAGRDELASRGFDS